MVSDELPQKKQIHETWHVRADYFAELATAVAADSQQAEGDVPESWGLVAARLGNSLNRNKFRGTAWFGRGDDVPGLQAMLKEWESDSARRPPWTRRKNEFRAAGKRVEQLKQSARKAGQRIERLCSIENESNAARSRMRSLDHRIVEITAFSGQLRSDHDRAAEFASACGARRSRHVETRPGWLENLFDWGRILRNWRAELARIDEELGVAERAVDAIRMQLHQSAIEFDRTRYEQATEQDLLRRLTAEQDALDRAVADDAHIYGPTYPGTVWTTDARAREMHSAWQNSELNAARADLFVAALQLHHAFLANAHGIRQSLQASMEVMVGSAPADLDPDARKGAWQMFFLAVPLVSTTFASVGRMLGGTGPEAFGWLFIDEAGQAAPQAAVGAIWRAKRTLAVGDPMQLTPVVTMPRRAQHDLATRFGIENTWIPSYTSVQQLADRVGKFGTTLTNGEEPTWVSAPLLVHRRCDSPMFDVSNAIAYENMMVDGVLRSAQAIEMFADIEPSRWVDVPGPVAGSHLQSAELVRLREQIDYLLERGLQGSDLIAISPFRAIAQELERVADDYPGMRGGTIHTAQGREASVVFLVLGGDPARPGAKRWASNAPNLVNVAASRAKRRLYVIGDREGWQSWPHFDTLATALDAYQSVAPQ